MGRRGAESHAGRRRWCSESESGVCGAPWREGRGVDTWGKDADRPRWKEVGKGGKKGKKIHGVLRVGAEFSCSYCSKSSGRASVSAGPKM